VNPVGRFGAPETEPGLSGVGSSLEAELLTISFPRVVRSIMRCAGAARKAFARYLKVVRWDVDACLNRLRSFVSTDC